MKDVSTPNTQSPADFLQTFERTTPIVNLYVCLLLTFDSGMSDYNLPMIQMSMGWYCLKMMNNHR